MVIRLEVFADITCPFTHVGLRKVRSELADLGEELELVVRSWPLEWVNGEIFEGPVVQKKIQALRNQIGTDAFGGFRVDTWPTTTIPALNLAAAGRDVDVQTGLAVSLAVRDALFEEGQDVSDPVVLASLARRFGLDPPGGEASERVRADYEDGRRRGVRGSPDFWIGEEEFFCPALKLGHDDGGLTVEFDSDGLQRFLDRIRASSLS